MFSAESLLGMIFFSLKYAAMLQWLKLAPREHILFDCLDCLFIKVKEMDLETLVFACRNLGGILPSHRRRNLHKALTRTSFH